MILLGIESSCDRVSVALWRDGRVDERRLADGTTPSDALIPTIRTLLAEHGLRLDALDAIALGVGPGAFTALRLGCSVAQGLALAAGLPVVPVCSLEAIAAAQSATQVLVATDARMGEIYTACYRRDGDALVEVRAPACLPPEMLEVPAGEWSGAGNAFAAYADRLAAQRARLRDCVDDAVPGAGEIVRLAAARGPSAALDAAQVGPLYVRDKVALTVAERLARGGRA